MGVSSEQSSNNMNRFVACAFVACVSGAPQLLHHGVSTVGHASYAGPAQVTGVSHGPTVAHGAPVASAPVVTGQTHQTYAAGAPVVEQHTEYGVVGSQVVQTGHASVIGGYTHAPADTVVQQKILAPVRTHTRITPQQTNIIPKVEVQNYNVDVPVHVPVPVERTVIVNKHVPAPYEVPVPRAVPVAAPYKVHPVQEIVETPHVHHATYTTHHKQPVVTSHSTPVHETVHVPVHTEQTHVVHGLAYAQAPAVAHVATPAVAHVAYGHAAGHVAAAH